MPKSGGRGAQVRRAKGEEAMSEREMSTVGAWTASPPPSLKGRVFGRWARVVGPFGPVDVAFAPDGVQMVRPAAAGEDSNVLSAEYRRRFGRPLLPAAAPRRLAKALASLDGRGLRYDLSPLGPFERAV